MSVQLEQLQKAEAKVVGMIAEVADAIDNMKSALSRLQVERDMLQNEIRNFEPIKDSIAWIASFSRSGHHLTVVSEGRGFCTCEDARFRPESGGCKHWNEAVTRGFHDYRAEFYGGFDGPVELDYKSGNRAVPDLWRLDLLVGN